MRSEWAGPDEAYEGALREFITGTLDPKRPVLGEIRAFAARLDLPGAVNGLAQTVLRLAAPGVPDLYQGAELWDQSLVDPDNRRPVDFNARAAMLAAQTPPAGRLARWRDGAVKQAVIARALALRARCPAVFAAGDYQRLEAEGPAAAHVLAFIRCHKGRMVIAAVTRLPAALVADVDEPLVPPALWQGTTLTLPSPGPWRNAFDSEAASWEGAAMPVAALFARLPVALLYNNAAMTSV